jgi:hypothetical protein
MKGTTSKISFLPSLLIAGVLLNVCLAHGSAVRLAAESQQGIESFAVQSGGAPWRALTTGPRTHSEVPASKQKRLRHPALDFTALPPERFTPSSVSLGQPALDNDLVVFDSSFSVRPKGRAPPVSV